MPMFESESPKCYLVLYNIMKHANFGFLLRTASAFGVCEVIIVGKRRFDVGGACGQARAVRKRHFHTLDLACGYLRSQGCSICGLEITPLAEPIHQHPFRGSTAFMVGNEGTGLTAYQMSLCDHFVFIPQFGSADCVNVNVATGITLHHFALWAGFQSTGANPAQGPGSEGSLASPRPRRPSRLG